MFLQNLKFIYQKLATLQTGNSANFQIILIDSAIDAFEGGKAVLGIILIFKNSFCVIVYVYISSSIKCQ